MDRLQNSWQDRRHVSYSAIGPRYFMSKEPVANASVARLPVHEETLHYLEIAQRSAGMGYISLDPATMRLTFSSWVCELLGLESPVMAVDQVVDYVVPEERHNLTRQIAKVVEDRAPFEFETVAVRFDGSPTRLRVAGDAIFEGDTLTAFYAIAQDVEGFRKAEQDARASAERAEAELAASAQVMATLSHEIRTPLTGIVGIIDHLRREPRAAERSRGLTLIEQSVEALLETLDGVLQGARARALGLDKKRQEFAPAEVARRVADLFRPLARRKGVTLTFDAAVESEPTRCHGHPSQLQQVLSNLVSNAIKFTSAGDVYLACEQPADDGETWRFRVKDTGSGMPRERLQAIFTAFGSSSSDSLGRTTGAGLGLSITKQLVDEMGGTLAIESDPGTGTSAIVEIAFERVSRARHLPGIGGQLFYQCSSASRAIAISAAAEEAGFTAVPLTGTGGEAIEASGILVSDEGLLASLPEDSLSRFSTVIEICDIQIDTLSIATTSDGRRSRIPGAALTASLQQVLAAMAAS